MLNIVLIVLFVMTMFLWLLSLLGDSPEAARYSRWLPFFASLLLGIWIALYGTGVIVVNAARPLT